MRIPSLMTCTALITLAGCHDVFGTGEPGRADASEVDPDALALDAPAGSSFCAQTPAPVFCEDFDRGPSDAFANVTAAWMQPDTGSGLTYEVDTMTPRSQRRAVRLGVMGTGTISARLRKDISSTDGRIVVGLGIRIDQTTPLSSVKLLQVRIGPLTAGGQREVSWRSNGAVFEGPVGGPAVMIGSVVLPPAGTWFYATMAFALDTPTATVAVGHSGATGSPIPLMTGTDTYVNQLEFGPAAPEPVGSHTWRISYDDVLVSAGL